MSEPTATKKWAVYSVGSCDCPVVEGYMGPDGTWVDGTSPGTEHRSFGMWSEAKIPAENKCDHCGKTFELKPFPALLYMGFSGRDKEFQTWESYPPPEVRPRGFHPYVNGIKSRCGIAGCFDCYDRETHGFKLRWNC